MLQFEKVVGRRDCRSITELEVFEPFLKVLRIGLKWLFRTWFYLLKARAKELTIELDRLRLIELCTCLKVRDWLADSSMMGLLLA
jgi:hypothetical protein